VPNRTSRTILMLVIIAVEVLLLLKDTLPTIPRVSSYVASSLTVVGTIAGLAYSDIVGRVRPLSVAIVLLLYWFICSTLQMLRSVVCFMSEPSFTSNTDVCLLLDTFLLLIYLSLYVLECFWIIRNVSMNLCQHMRGKLGQRNGIQTGRCGLCAKLGYRRWYVARLFKTRSTRMPKIKVKLESAHKQTDVHTHRRYQTYYLPCYAVDKNSFMALTASDLGTDRHQTLSVV